MALLYSVKAQLPIWDNENFKQHTILIESDTLNLSHQAILPEKFKITNFNNEEIPELLYNIDFAKGRIVFDKSLLGDSLKIGYFVHPELYKESIFSKDTTLIRTPFEEHRYYSYTRQKREIRNPFDGLNSRGSLVRGIRFGNSQNASVQSSLDLQLTGQLSEEIGINAVISDNNVPIQADGYTQQLKEFDKIYIELFNKNSKIRAGHVDLLQENNFFGNFSQKVTGLQVQTELTHANDSKTRIHLAGSTTRGEFATKKFNGQNGNQGPYRLSGNNNELYIIIVSGSEKVYIDGIQLTRGEDRDYIINYNTGELTFTTNRLITENDRITVEYLYANRTYSQFLLYGGIEHESERFRIAGHFYSNGDSKNNPLNDDLSDEDKQILAEAGNNTDEMYNTTAVPTDYDPDKNLYRKTLFDGVEIFEFSNNPDDELYQVSFTYMGNNQGNYIQSNVEVNGKIFEYVPPINGIPQGNYEPIRKLVPPKRLQLYTINSAYKLRNNGEIGIDLAMSNEDLNLFSNKDNEDNIGFAGRIFGRKTYDLKRWKITPQFETSFIQSNFRSIERLRSIEFSRDFNLENEFLQTDQTYIKLGLKSSFRDSLKFNYNLHYLENKDQYVGIKNDLNLIYQTDKNYAEGNFSYLNSTQENLLNPQFDADKTKFLRYRTIAKRKLNEAIWIGAQYSGENNEIEDHENFEHGNSLSNLSFRWDEIRGMIGVGDTAKVFAELSYYNRRDDSVRMGNLQRISKSNGFILQSRLINQAEHRLELGFHYRSVDYEEEEKEDYISGNLRWNKSFFRNGLILNAYYELGSGVEPQREFEYVKVTDGTGIYKWTDYNGDGIEQLDEFEVAQYQDEANYIRVYTNTINYVNTNKNAFNFSMRIRIKELLQTENDFLKRWMIQSSLQSSNSYLKEGNTLNWNPFENSDLLLGKNKSFRSSFHFNHGAQYKWSSSYTFADQEVQTYVFTGAEFRDSQSHVLTTKYKAWDNFNLSNEIETNKIVSGSDMFESRRFTLETWRFKPEISYQIETKFVAALNYTFQNKNNLTGIEKLKQSNFGAELQWNDAVKSSILANFNFIKNDFSGNQQSVVGNQMMEGLKSGNNYVWQLLIQRQLNSFLSINITYDGRKSMDTKAIHSGSIQIQARF